MTTARDEIVETIRALLALHFEVKEMRGEVWLHLARKPIVRFEDRAEAEDLAREFNGLLMPAIFKRVEAMEWRRIRASTGLESLGEPTQPMKVVFDAYVV